MKAKIEFGQFVDALVEAKGIVDKAALLESELDSLESNKASYTEAVLVLKREMDGLGDSLRQQKETIAKDLADSKAAADDAMHHYKSMIELEKESLRGSVLTVRSETEAAIKDAKKAREDAQAAARVAKEELDVLRADLEAARSAAAKLASFAAAGKA